MSKVVRYRVRYDALLSRTRRVDELGSNHNAIDDALSIILSDSHDSELQIYNTGQQHLTHHASCIMH